LQNAKNSTKRKLGVRNSIYYVYENKYYNAFNAEDINALISKMKTGYYGIYDRKLDGSPSDIQKITGDRKTFQNLNKRYLINDFKNGFYKKLIDFDKSHRLILQLSNDVKATINNQNYGFGELLDYDLGQDVTINDVPDLLDNLQKASS